MKTHRQRKQAHQVARRATIRYEKVIYPDGRIEVVPELGTFYFEDSALIFPIDDERQTEEWLKTKFGYCAAQAHAARI